jgi:CRISPR system Cascade subunit CasE
MKNPALGGVMAGKRVAIVVEADQIAWLLRKGMAGGFRIPGEWVERGGRRLPNFRVDVIPEGAVWCGKAGHRDGRFVAARFDGILEVTDPAVFRKTVEHGIGSGKSFGFGLLSVAPAG